MVPQYIKYNPIRWYTAPTIINTFIETYGFEGKTVVLFATSGGSTVDKANKDFAASYPAIKRKEDWKDNISFVGVHSAGAIRVTKGIQ